MYETHKIKRAEYGKFLNEQEDRQGGIDIIEYDPYSNTHAYVTIELYEMPPELSFHMGSMEPLDGMGFIKTPGQEQ